MTDINKQIEEEAREYATKKLIYPPLLVANARMKIAVSNVTFNAYKSGYESALHSSRWRKVSEEYKQNYNSHMRQQKYEYIAGVFEFISDDYIIVDKLVRCGLGIREVVDKLDRDINVSSEQDSGYDSYSFRAVNSADNVKLEFADPKDEQRFTEMGFTRYSLVTEEDISERLKADIDKEYQSFKTINNSDPLFAGCNVRYGDEESSFPVTIKLSSDFDDEEDYSVFFYCNSIEDLKSLTVKGAQDFTIR